MGIFLDSASAEEARAAFKLGFLTGITTNPKLLAASKLSPEEVIQELCMISTGPVLYQLTAPTPKEKEEEARKFFRMNPKKVVLKVPSTSENSGLIFKLINNHMPCAATAVFTATQGYLASEAGARYLIPYVNRVTREGGDGMGLVRQLAAVARASGKGAEVLAASLKTPQEVVEALSAGAHHVTVPAELLKRLGDDPKSDEAVKEFAEAARVRQITPSSVYGK